MTALYINVNIQKEKRNLTGRQIDVRVLLEVVERRKVVMKLPSAKLDSEAGIVI